MQITTKNDAFGRTVTISDKQMVMSKLTGLLPVAHVARELGFFDQANAVLQKAHPAKKNSKHRADSMFLQRVMGLVAGYEDLNDHDSLFEDSCFASAVGTVDGAGSSSLCRFENSINEEDIKALNEALFSTFCSANDKVGLLPSYRKKQHRCLFLDVDSTHIDLYGNQEEKSYNGHYQCNCLAPVLCYLHGYPIAIYGAAGTKDARKVLEDHLADLLDRVKKAFPQYRLVLRGDAGFNSNAIISTCETAGVHYVTGLTPFKSAQKHIEKNGLKYANTKKVKRYTTSGTTERTIGGTNWQAKSWEQERRVIGRKRHDPKTDQMDLRLIQTNILWTRDEKAQGYAGELSHCTMSELYEKVYCGRGRMEQWIGEFKSDCHGARSSATRFHTNCYRMILSAFCQMLLKIVRRLQYFGIRKKNKNAVIKSVRKFRRDAIYVPAVIREMKHELRLTLPTHIHDREGFEALFAIQI